MSLTLRDRRLVFHHATQTIAYGIDKQFCHRKGRNNSLTAKPGEPGSPWAIGSEEGGHKAVEMGKQVYERGREVVDEAREVVERGRRFVRG